MIRKRKTEIKVTPWYVVPRPQANAHDDCINPDTKHIFISFFASVNLGLCLFFIVNHYRRERLSPSLIKLSSSEPGDHHTCYRSGCVVLPRVSPVLWSLCTGLCCSRCSLVIGPFSQEHTSDWLRRSSFKSSSSSSL